MSYPIFFVSAKMVQHPGRDKRIEPTTLTKFGVRMANSGSTLIFTLRNKSYHPLAVSVHLSLGQIRRDWQSALVCDSHSIVCVPFLSALQALIRHASERTQQQPKSGISHHSGLNCQTKCASRIVRSSWSRVGNAMLHLWNSRQLVNQR
jgi:hypothetical protein